VVWETALAALHAVARSRQASPAEFEGLNRILKIGTAMAPVSQEIFYRKIAARLPNVARDRSSPE